MLVYMKFNFIGDAYFGLMCACVMTYTDVNSPLRSLSLLIGRSGTEQEQKNIKGANGLLIN